MRFFFSLVALTVATQAARLPAATLRPALHKRQVATATSATLRTLGYYSVANNEEGYVNWGSYAYYEYDDNTLSNYAHFTKSDNFYQICSLSYVYTQSTYFPVSTFSCPIWTTYSLGTLWAQDNTASLFCNNGASVCYTDYLYSTLGASEPRTNLYCAYFYSNSMTTRSLYAEKPPATVRPSSIPASNSASTTAGSVSTGLASTTSTSPSTSSALVETSAPVPISAPNNTKVIAGSVVGGVLGLALAAVAVLLILKHYRYRAKPEAAETFTQAAYYQDKPRGHGDVPEWVPSTPATSPTPYQTLRYDGYPPDSIRSGTIGAGTPWTTSPTH